MEDLKFSIIIPIYNVEDYLEYCIDSILKQSYRNIEIILVDDGSKDKCGQICDSYKLKDNRIKVIHKENGGLSDSRNAGIDSCSGEYIIFLDGDDYFEGDFIKDIYLKIKDKKPDVIINDGYLGIFPDNKREDYIVGLEEKINEITNGEELLKYLMTYKNAEGNMWRWAAWNNIYKTELIKDNKLYFKKGLLCEDAEWTPRVILKSKSFALNKKPFYMYRLNRKNSIMSVVSEKRIKDFLWITEKWYKHSKEFKDMELRNVLRFRYCNELFNYLKYVYNFDKETKSDYIKRLKDIEFSSYIDGKRNKIIAVMIKVFGYKFAIVFLYFLYSFIAKIRRV